MAAARQLLEQVQKQEDEDPGLSSHASWCPSFPAGRIESMIESRFHAFVCKIPRTTARRKKLMPLLKAGILMKQQLVKRPRMPLQQQKLQRQKLQKLQRQKHQR